MSSKQHEVMDIQDSLEDSGVTHLAPVPCSLSSLEAELEKLDVTKRLKSSDLMQEDSRQQRGEVTLDHFCWFSLCLRVC